MDKLIAIKIKYDDGTYSDEIPIGALAKNVEWNSSYSLIDILGEVAYDTKGSIQDQISQLFNEKIDYTQLNNYVVNQLSTSVTSWLNANVDPIGSAVVVDKSLTVEGSAADAKIVGNKFDILKDIGLIVITKDMLEQGGFTGTGGINQVKNRIRLIRPFFLNKGTKITFNIGQELYWDLWELTNSNTTGNNIKTTTSWTRKNQYIVQSDGYIMIAIANASTSATSTDITIDDFLNYKIRILQYNIFNNYLFNNNITQVCLENGGFSTSGGLSFNKTRIRLISPFFLEKGTKLIFNIGDLYHRIWELGNKSTDSNNIIYLYSEEWNQNKTYIVKNNCWLMISFATAETEQDSVEISVDDFDENYNVQIYKNNLYLDKFLFEKKINNVLFEDGGFTAANGKVDTNYRIRLIYPLFLNKNTKLIFNTNIFRHMIWQLSDNSTLGGNAIVSQSWNENEEYIVRNDCYIMIALSYASGDRISIKDFNDNYFIQVFNSNYFSNLNSIFNNYLNINNADTILKMENFSSLFENGIQNDSFLFFTDSHFLNDTNGDELFEETLLKMGSIYNQAPLDFCIYGGDAITGKAPGSTHTTKQQALKLLAKHDKMCKMTFGFDKYFPIVGNHDYNYITTNNDLTNNDLINVWFRKQKSTYYSYLNNNAIFYFLNSGMNHNNGDYNVPMDNFKWEQLDWLGKKLINDDIVHSIVVMHIIYNNNATYKTFLFFENINKLCAAYNNHSSIILNNITYDFTNCTGKVELILGGHLHTDTNFVMNDIPCVIRANTQFNDIVPTFDLVMCDWDIRKISFIKIGSGEDLIINI